jgi:uncharacterized coiled-coil protein SlyX
MPTLEARVTRLESRVTRVEKRMDDEARLRASMDRDLADISEKLRVQIELIQALAQTQSEHTAVLARQGVLMERMAGEVDVISGGMKQVIAKVTVLVERDNNR